jgi:HEAT repeat protein
MTRLAELLQIRAGEGRMALLLIGVMLATMAGSSLGSTGIEALFFARFGVEYLPYMYMALGLVSFVTSLGVTAMLGRLPRQALYVALPLALALLLVGARVLLTLNLVGFYPVLWLGKEVMNSLISLFSWGLAGAVCDTRQAKRLFPIFGAGRIFGAVLGGVGTGALVNWFGTENLLLAWAAAMFVAFALGRALISSNRPHRSGRPVRSRKSRRPQPSLITEMQRGYQFVRRSPLMQWVSIAAVLFSILYFSIALPFSRAATEQYVSENALAGFLGLFNGLSTGAAFLASLFVANRLNARFGIMRSLLAFPVIYLLGFGALIATGALPQTAFAVIVVFRFTQMVWLSGIADSAYQAMFNAVPIERRDQVRAFIGGVPEQAGTFLAGAILFIGEQTLAPQQLYVVGLIAAALTTFVIWRAARAYGRALVEALRAGQPQLFPGAEEPLSVFQSDATAAAVALDGISHAEPFVRRLAAEMLGGLSTPRALSALVNALRDAEASVRAAALRALARAKAVPALLDVAARLRDPDPEVRVQAIESLRALAGYPEGLVAHVEPCLDDGNATVRARAALALLACAPRLQQRACELLRSMAMLGETDERVEALNALGEWGDAEALPLIEDELCDLHAPTAVRRAAASALAGCGLAAINPLADALGDGDRAVRNAAAQALGRLGPAALERTLAALSQPGSESGALLALERLPVQNASGAIRDYARERVTSALHYGGLWRAVEPFADDDRTRLLAESLRDKARRHGLNALRAARLLGEREALTVAIDNLQSRNPNQRANALETLEAARDSQMIRPLLRLWESSPAPSPANGQFTATLISVLQDPDPWLRACAALASTNAAADVRAALAQLAQSDPDPNVRDTASAVLQTGATMDTLQTLPLMERVLFLRRVPLFADLAPADLRQVAAIASEHSFADGDVIAAQGEPGEELYIITSGEVGVRMAAEGKPETEVVRRKAGEYVGEMAIITQEPRIASLVAAGDVRTLCIDRQQFEGLLRERPETGLAVMRVLCARLKEATK